MELCTLVWSLSPLFALWADQSFRLFACVPKTALVIERESTFAICKYVQQFRTLDAWKGLKNGLSLSWWKKSIKVSVLISRAKSGNGACSLTRPEGNQASSHIFNGSNVLLDSIAAKWTRPQSSSYVAQHGTRSESWTQKWSCSSILDEKRRFVNG